MGGRGKSLSLNYKQIDIKNYKDRLEIEDIMHNADIVRQALNAINRDSSETSLFRKCYCCEEHIIPINSFHKKCNICGWIDDDYQNINPNSHDGPNELSLNESKIIFWRKEN
ncbi:CPCC family cysteine-rich protein [Clostridium ljungdahlii]|uniref:Cysteine-rich CPCC domain-containing protein n=1 Tax=Clostridium ljungdahlii TaxID=1538 RepID=A0A162KSZ5_9CLOT|nr:CPCC family cysteine-rich protein [Clostridium ljungdahlii]OAA83566.1 hypothetical protein WY13_03353 [Clostridium ljungdahlii]